MNESANKATGPQDHPHHHSIACGHEMVPHGDHMDYLVNGHLHHVHGDHCDDQGPVEIIHTGNFQ